MNALIVAAGLGTRLRPQTDTMPKALVPVAGRPMLEHQILKLKAAGFDHIVINVHHFGEQIIDYVKANDSFGLRIDISDERSLLLDTGGAVRQASRFFTDGLPVLIHNVDIFSNADLGAIYRQHIASGADATLLVSERKTSRYLYFDESQRLRGWKNISSGAVKSPFADVREHLSTPLNNGEWRMENGDLATQENSLVIGNNSQFSILNSQFLTPYAFAGIHVVSPSLFPSLSEQGEVFSIIDYYLSASADYDVRALPAPPTFRLVDAGKPESLPLAAELV